MQRIAPGTQIAHFRVEEKLGAGSCGEVYRAEDIYLKRPVALKILQMVESKEAKERFLQEARFSSTLVHSNIAVVYEAGWYESNPYIAMELVEGELLSRKIRMGEITYPDALHYMRQILEALEEAHSRDILHRDIKSSNMMVTARGKVKVLDFGMATSLDPKQQSSDRSLGTLEFLSPEQARGEEPDERSDLFAAGVVFYHMLSGRLPFERGSRVQTFSAILNEDIVPLSHVPDAVNAILQKALAKDRETRYKDAAEFLRALSAVISMQPERQASIATPITIAVLYFDREDETDESDYLRLGITEDIITDLSRVAGVKVLSRHAIAKYRDRKFNLAAAAQDLQVRYLLHGSLSISGEVVQVHAQLFDATNSNVVWTERYSSRTDQIFELQEHVANSIYATLQLRLTQSEQRAIEQHPTHSFQAYEFYLRGRHHFSLQNPEQNKLAETCLLRSLDLDPSYAAALAALSEVYVQRFYNWFDRDRMWLARAEEVIERAAKINDHLPEVHCTLGMLLYLRGEYQLAMEEIQKAIRLDPHYAVAHDHSGEIYLHVGEMDQAILAFHTELKINAEAIYPYFYLVWIHSLLSDFSIARAVLEQARKKHSENPLLNVLYGTFASYSGEIVEAQSYLTKAIQINANNSFATARLSVVFAQMQDFTKALDLAVTATESIDPMDHHAAFDRGLVHCLSGDHENALIWLNRAVQLGWRCRYHFQNEPNLAALRGDVRFAALLSSVSTH